MGTPIVNLRQIVTDEVDSNVDIAAVHQAQTEITDAVVYVDNKANNIAGEVQTGTETLDQHTIDKIAELDAEVVADKEELTAKGDAEVARVDAIADDRLAEYNDNAIGDGTDDLDTGGKLGYFNHNYAVKYSTMQTTYDQYVTISVSVEEDAEQVALDRAQVELLYDTFDDKWLGPKATDPTTDNDGDAIAEGALYWSTTNDVLMIYAPSLGGWTQGTVTASTLQAIASIEDSITEIEAVGTELENKVYEGNTKSSIEVVADNVTDIGTVAGVSAEVSTVAGDTIAVNEIYDNRAEIYAADDNAAIATTKASEASTSADAALASENKAEKWATEVTDTEVEPGLYSAKHYAEKADVDKMVWKGEWVTGAYEINDVVRYGTNNYIVVVASTVEEPSIGIEWEISMEGAAPHYTFTQDGTELVISSAGYVQFPVVEGEW